MTHCSDLAVLLSGERPDVVVLAREMVLASGVSLRQIRSRWPTINIVVVGATDEHDVSQLLDAGADDAVTVTSVTLVSRLHANARRARTVNAGMRIAVGDIVFDRESHRVWCAGREVALTPTEEALLDCMFWNSSRAVGVATLSDFVWGEEVTPERRGLIRVYIGYLRAKLQASRKVAIRTVHGIGYGFAPR